ncbi:MAG: hypothetical protein AAF567_18040 [Actinomycetota bacterium]
MSVLATELQQATKWLEAACAEGLDGIGSASEAMELLDGIERVRRLASVLAVDSVALIEDSGAHRDHGHVDASTMYKATSRVSSAESTRLKKIDRMLRRCDLIAQAWRDGQVNLDQAGCLARAFANPRVRERFTTDDSQRWMLAKARRLSFKKFERAVADWVRLHDLDGVEPDADPSHERRDTSMVQDHFSTAWHLRAQHGSLAGSIMNKTLEAYTQAEFLTDWQLAEEALGEGNVSRDQLARTDAQRRADALAQIFADAIDNPNRSTPVETVHNLVWSQDTFEETLRRFFGVDPEPLDPDAHRCTTLDGEPVNTMAAFADLLTSSWRRVVVDAAGVVVDLSKKQRFYTGLARVGVRISSDECYWPGCDLPASRCQIDHLKPAARGGLTTQGNGKPGCERHNRVKELGYVVTRQPDGAITIICPNGDTLISAA